ncbi:MAG: grasp-with-spasm system ATP-grasp peptide maturase [Chitinophaga sp.]|uniref:grasp-with-spasm system ATP-grasp peptide maturase n=1 Tax=Chitinophaga sp. TaxID=1869181 RepID=UPI001B2E3691|nr:grasp-with-spasm system ATP-grasp peptide maturase [Chitinophaga sp.]MBO9729714.1 grasp-with-spasm system ATP-grasp peptide maturase [Chitinophaga sp.]
MNRKILILSHALLETSTDKVCKWLDYYQVPFLRLNGEDLFQLNGLNALPQNETIAAVWYRRRVAEFPSKYSLKKEHAPTSYTLRRFLIDEFKGLHSLLFHTIDRHKWLNDPVIEDNLNKLHVSMLAGKHGLQIPFTEVVTTKSAVVALLEKYTALIVKPLSECIFVEDESRTKFKMLTKVISASNLKLMPDQFFPSMVQEKIEKKYEVRAFYLDGNFYSMAIFSQNNKKTKDDFRNYDEQRPNRTVPYQLPADVEDKLRKVMQELHFGTGSIDLMVDRHGSYYFLEVNPAGQFGMVSFPCNYHLEKKMAQLLRKAYSHEEEVHQ